MRRKGCSAENEHGHHGASDPLCRHVRGEHSNIGVVSFAIGFSLMMELEVAQRQFCCGFLLHFPCRPRRSGVSSPRYCVPEFYADRKPDES